VKTQVFQKLKGINPANDLSVIIAVANDTGPTLDLLRPFFSELPGVNLQVLGRELSPKVAATISRQAADKGSNFTFSAPNKSQSPLHSFAEALQSCQTEYFVFTQAGAMHPLELIRDLLTELDYGADLAICSRIYSASNEKNAAYLLQRSRSLFARLSLRKAAVPVRDPLSEYFAGKTSTVLSKLKGSKPPNSQRSEEVLLEILRRVRRELRVAEVNYLVPSLK